MQESGMAAVGKFVLWGKENLCLIRAQDDTLAMQTLFYADDVRSKAEIEEAVESTELRDAELKLAEQVIDSLVGEWNPEDFANEYRQDLKAMLDAKLAGEKITRPEPAPETPVIDLMEALRRSVADVQEKKTAAKPRKTKAASSEGGSRRKAPARKSA
jgi:DNA end-binding protein Ku